METKKIDLFKYRGKDSSLFTGRPQGEAARRELDLDKNDRLKKKLIFVIPKDTSSINPSFYLGLLYDSIKKFGFDKFENYYSFEIAEEDPERRKVLLSNLEDGKRNALNTILGKTGLGRFINNY
jgi:hypothetical protein